MPGNQLLITSGFTFHWGHLPDTGFHRHGDMIFLASRGQHAFQVQLDNGETIEAHSALVAAGVNHRLISHGEAVCAAYIEGDQMLAQHLRNQLLQNRPLITELCSRQRLAYMTSSPDRFMQLEHYFPHAPSSSLMDARVHRAMALMRRGCSFSHIARQLHLSESRLSHLFRQHLGTSFKHYRLWQQSMQLVKALSVQPQFSLTHHALDQGFSDSAHLSNTFRKLIGLSPRQVLGSYDQIIQHRP